MAEIKAAEISAILKEQLAHFDANASLEEVGTVLQVGDGIARIFGLSNAQYGELVKFDNGLQGIVLNLEEDNVGITLLGPSTDIKEGDTIKRTGLIASISVGVKDYEYDFVSQLKSDAPEYITIDIAHGHADSVISMIQHIKKELPDTFVIAGNVGTPEAVRELENAGADATKVGIGPGKVCITKVKTGFGTGGWQLAALRWCAKAARKPIIADGGIRTHGDIAKSIRFGASMVMIGSLFAGHIESPGKTIEVDGEQFKEYYGSASQYQKGAYKNVEGKRILLPAKGHLQDTLTEMEQDLQSAISYAGGRQVADLKHVDYVIVKNSIWNGDASH